ncbi:MAG: aspartyl protease family protein [Myxococcota bacterium]|nr:aspartyl protease family protein [Myxococcota bacterium]
MLLLLLSACEPSPYGVYATAIDNHRKSVAAAPCKTDSVNALATTLAEAGDGPAAMQVYSDFHAACGENKTLMSKHLDLAIQLADHAKAIELAQALSDGKPNSPYADQLVAELALAGRQDEALTLRRQQVAARGSKGHRQLRALAELQEELQKPCDAMVTWGQLWFVSPELRGTAGTAIATLEGQHPECEGVQLKEEGKVRQDPSDGYWRFETQLAGKELWLGLDTSAAWTYVDAAAMEGAEGVTEVMPHLSMLTGVGTLEGKLVHVDSIQVGTVTFKNVDLLVVPRLPSKIDGFLALNVSSRMGMRELNDRYWSIAPL